MANVKIKVEVQLNLSSDQQEKYKINSDKVTLRGQFPVRAEVDKDHVFYLGQVSVEDWELDHYVKGKGDSFQLVDHNDQEVSKKEQVYEDFKGHIIDTLNQDISSGLYDTQIKERYRKDKTSVKVKAADIGSRHRASPLNVEHKDHNWIPRDDAEGESIPSFKATNNSTGELMGTYNKINTACIDLGGLSHGNVRLCLRGKRATVEGYHFEFVEPNSADVLDWLDKAERKANGEEV